MKKNVLLASAMALLSLAACKKEDVKPETPDRSEHIYTFEASAATKATLGESCVEWAEGDVIGTFAKGYDNEPGRVKVGTPCTFPVKTAGKLAAGEKVYAYAPYGKDAASEATKVTFEIPSEQVSDKISMPLAAQPYEVTEELADNTETAVAGMNFYNLASVAVVKLYATGDVAKGEKIQSIKLTSTSTADICGSYTLDLTAIDPEKEETLALSQTAGVQTVTVTLPTPVEVAATEDAAVSVPVVLAPGTYPLELTVVTDQASYIKATSEDVELLRSHRRALVLDIASAKPSGMVITPSELRSFGRGESLEYEIELTGVADNVTAVAPEGWTATVSDKKLTVTASTEDSKALSGKVTVSAGKFTEELEVRRSGLNNQEDLVEFTKSVGNMIDDKFIKDIDVKYLDNEEISINADIEIPSSSVAYGAYWLKRLRVPLNGNGHKLTFNTTLGTRGGLIQNLGANVHDLVLDGTINATNNTANGSFIGSIACFLSEDGLTVSNVTSNVKIVLGGSNLECRLGGIIGAVAKDFHEPKTFTMQNCKFDGSIEVNTKANAVGGMLGAFECQMPTLNMNGCHFNGQIVVNGEATAVGGLLGKVDKKVSEFNATDCQFNGSIAGNGNATAVGGMLGNAGNNGLHATFTGCKASSTAKITCKDGVAQYVGGFVGSGGVCGNPGEIMTMKDCSFEGAIELSTNKDVTNSCYVRIGGFLGNLERGAEFTNCKFSGTITADWNKHKALIDSGTGLGGFVGRTAGYSSDSKLNMKANFADCVSKGTITILNSVESENANKARVGHLIGISNYGDAFVNTGCSFESTITLNGKPLTVEGK